MKFSLFAYICPYFINDISIIILQEFQELNVSNRTRNCIICIYNLRVNLYFFHIIYSNKQPPNLCNQNTWFMQGCRNIPQLLSLLIVPPWTRFSIQTNKPPCQPSFMMMALGKQRVSQTPIPQTNNIERNLPCSNSSDQQCS